MIKCLCVFDFLVLKVGLNENIFLCVIVVVFKYNWLFWDKNVFWLKYLVWNNLFVFFGVFVVKIGGLIFVNLFLLKNLYVVWIILFLIFIIVCCFLECNYKWWWFIKNFVLWFLGVIG